MFKNILYSLLGASYAAFIIWVLYRDRSERKATQEFTEENNLAGCFKEIKTKHLQISEKLTLPALSVADDAPRHVEPPDFLFPKIQPLPLVSMICPSCKTGYLRKIRGRFGMFYGCSRYPSCHFTASTKLHYRLKNVSSQLIETQPDKEIMKKLEETLNKVYDL